MAESFRTFSPYTILFNKVLKVNKSSRFELSVTLQSSDVIGIAAPAL